MAAPSTVPPANNEYMKIAGLRFSASQGKAAAKAEMLELIKKRGEVGTPALTCCVG